MKKISFSFCMMSFGIFYVLLSPQAQAETYRCVKNGNTTYSEIPCVDGESTQIQIKPSVVSAQEYQRAIERDKKNQVTLQKVEAEQKKEALQREKASKALANKHQKQKAKCEDLQLKVKWAREDAAQANPKSEAKARKKLKRVIEKAALSCPAN